MLTIFFCAALLFGLTLIIAWLTGLLLLAAAMLAALLVLSTIISRAIRAALCKAPKQR